MAEIYSILADGGPASGAGGGTRGGAARAWRHDLFAQEALERLAVWLGRFAGDAALFFGAPRGLHRRRHCPRMVDMLSAGRFRRAFEAKGRMSTFLAPIPVCVILASDAALKGAAAALVGRMGDI